eukprot:Amastigsp_a342658_19.p3 type:complete len:187 gc:universal Amastigsp_a342658_19:2200-1640(-)
MSDSMRFLRSALLTGNLSCWKTSWRSAWWVSRERVFMTRTMAASIWYWRSCITFADVTPASSRVSLSWTWLILRWRRSDVNAALYAKVSVVATFFDFGVLSSTRLSALPHESESNVRSSSEASSRVAAAISAWVSSSRSLKSSSTRACDSETESVTANAAFGNTARTVHVASVGTHWSLREVCLLR